MEELLNEDALLDAVNLTPLLLIVPLIYVWFLRILVGNIDSKTIHHDWALLSTTYSLKNECADEHGRSRHDEDWFHWARNNG